MKYYASLQLEIEAESSIEATGYLEDILQTFDTKTYVKDSSVSWPQYRKPEGAKLDDLPPLIIEPDGSSGLTIKAHLGKKYNCVEFTLRADVPQTIFISPWMQFEPANLNNDRQQIATEMIRRANAYAGLVKQLEDMQGLLENWRDAVDKEVDQKGQVLDMMRKLVKDGDNHRCLTALPEGTDVTELLTYKPWVKP